MDEMKQCAAYFEQQNTDVIIYSGSIDRNGYDDFCSAIPNEKRDSLLHHEWRQHQDTANHS